MKKVTAAKLDDIIDAAARRRGIYPSRMLLVNDAADRQRERFAWFAHGFRMGWRAMKRRKPNGKAD